MKNSNGGAIVLILIGFLFMMGGYIVATKRVEEYKKSESLKLRELYTQDSLLQVKSDSIKTLQQELFKANTLRGLTATVYYPTGHQMRSGKVIPQHYTWSSAQVKYIAISQDLWSKHGGPLSFGDKILVKGTPLDAIYEVQDTMNKRHRNRIDILVQRGLINEQWTNIQITKV